MTVHHMQLIHQAQLIVCDDSSTASSEAEIKTNTPLKLKPDVEPVIRQSRKSVRFSAENEYSEIQHVDDMDQEEIANTWYSKREYGLIRAAYTATVRIMSTSRHLDNSEEHCTRGLEYRTPLGSQKRQSNKWNAIESVLNEQQRQRERSIHDDEVLSNVYKSVAFHCQREALERGLADAEAVNEHKVVGSPRKSPRRLSRSLMMRDPSARRRAVLDDLQKMLSGTNIVRS